MSDNVLSTSSLLEIFPSSYLRALRYLNSMYDILLLGDPDFKTRKHLLYLHDRLMCVLNEMLHGGDNSQVEVKSVALLRALCTVNGRDLWLMFTDASSKPHALIREIRTMLNILTNLVVSDSRHQQ